MQLFRLQHHKDPAVLFKKCSDQNEIPKRVKANAKK